MSFEQDSTEAALARALQALDEANGDIDQVVRDQPEAERLRPYLEFASQLAELPGEATGPPGDLRQELLAQAMRWNAHKQAGARSPGVQDSAFGERP